MSLLSYALLPSNGQGALKPQLHKLCIVTVFRNPINAAIVLVLHAQAVDVHVSLIFFAVQKTQQAKSQAHCSTQPSIGGLFFPPCVHS